MHLTRSQLRAAANEDLLDLRWPHVVPTLFADLAAYTQTEQFRHLACDPEHPTAFRRRRKLSLSALIALMLTGMRKSVETELDEFFAHLQQQA